MRQAVAGTTLRSSFISIPTSVHHVSSYPSEYLRLPIARREPGKSLLSHLNPRLSGRWAPSGSFATAALAYTTGPGLIPHTLTRE